jgi:hypothetical protein
VFPRFVFGPVVSKQRLVAAAAGVVSRRDARDLNEAVMAIRRAVELDPHRLVGRDRSHAGGLQLALYVACRVAEFKGIECGLACR